MAFPYFSPEISFGNLISAFAFLAAALFAWRDLSWRVKNLEEWKSSHEHSTIQAISNITLLREAVVKIEEIARGQERRMQIMEDRYQERRTH